MAHPNRKEASEGHNAKLRRLTDNYGSASGPKNNILAETNRAKGEGPEDDIGFGSDASAAKPRGDRPARRTMAANPVATYRKGGHVKKRADGGPTGSEDSITADMARNAAASRMRNATIRRADGGDVSSIEEANRDQAATARARGGRTKHGKGNTHVNIMVGQPNGPAGAPPMVPPRPVVAPPMVPPAGAMPPRPPMVPPGAPPGAPGPLAGPMAPTPPGMPPPGLMPPRASGGRIHKDAAEDRDLIKKTLKDEGLIRSDKAKKMQVEGETEGRASGGKIIGSDSRVKWGNVPSHMTAGTVAGESRLEKIKVQEKHGGLQKPQEV
jgi:hypothetical protein